MITPTTVQVKVIGLSTVQVRAISSRRVFLRNSISGISDPICNEIDYTLALGRDRKFHGCRNSVEKSYFQEILTSMKYEHFRRGSSLETDRFFFFFTLVTGHRRSLSLKLSDTRVCETQIRAHQLMLSPSRSCSSGTPMARGRST